MKCNKGVALSILSAVLFGLMPLIAKQLYIIGSNSMLLTFHRFFFGSIFMWIIIQFRAKETLSVSFLQLKKIAILSFFFMVTPMLLFASYNYIPSGLATTVHFVYPILVLLICTIGFHQKPGKVKILCCSLCMIGILFFYEPSGGLNIKGIAIAFLSGCSYSGYIVYLDRSGLQNLNPYKLCFYLSLLSSVISFLAALFSRQIRVSLSLSTYSLTILFAALVCIATVTFQIGETLCGPQKVSLLSTFEPLTSVLVGIVVYRERFCIRAGIGILLILLAITLLSIFDVKGTTPGKSTKQNCF
ncbi:MAG: DMT family transporter [Lawsonibacter sp.]|nr:DMT family transporter [Lawsonibacter sp.]